MPLFSCGYESVKVSFFRVTPRKQLTRHTKAIDFRFFALYIPSDMKPGRELDKLVAEKVFNAENLRPYSTCIEAAWEIVTHMKFSHTHGVFSITGPSDESDKWFCIFEKKWRGHNLDASSHWSSGDTAPHAICLAALKTFGVEYVNALKIKIPMEPVVYRIKLERVK